MSNPRAMIAGLVLLAGCTGVIDTGSDPNPMCLATEPGPSPIRRLTRFELNNTVRDLLGDTTRPADAFPPEEEMLGFDNNANLLTVSPLLAEQYMRASEGIARRATEDLASLLPCDPASVGEDACARELIETLGKRAWRRPLQPAEIDRLLAAFAWGRDNYDFRAGVEIVVQSLLQSPHFLYRVEVYGEDPDNDGVVKLDSYEVASRLSYLLWASMPDDELLLAAEAGLLSTPTEIEAQARRMIEDPKAKDAMRNFYRQWLVLEEVERLEKDTTLFPTYYPEVRALWAAETEAFLDHVIWEGDGTVKTLLTAPYSFMNADLAAFYGVSGPSGDALERVDLDPAERAGFLTHAAVLATHAKHNQTSPVQRGKFVREQLLCQLLPPPPDDIVITPPDLDPNLTTRERYAAHRENPFCAGCHVLMDPVGLGFEHLDGVGLWRDVENGDLPVDASGELIDTDSDGPFYGAVELANVLGDSKEVQDCVVTQWFRYGYGREETEKDSCTMQTLRGAFDASGGNLKELLVALTQTDAFLYRRVQGGAQ